jgi:uncharacterized membrane protein YukC
MYKLIDGEKNYQIDTNFKENYSNFSKNLNDTDNNNHKKYNWIYITCGIILIFIILFFLLYFFNKKKSNNLVTQKFGFRFY